MRVILIALAVLVVAAVALFPELRNLERSGLVELSEMGAFAPLVLIALYGVMASLLLPVFPLDMAAGAHFGFLEGVLWIQVAGTIGAGCGYFIGRTLLRGLVERLYVWKPELRKLDEAVVRDGWRIVLLTRLSPVFSFSILSAVYGAARVSFWPYILATFVGMIPGSMIYVYAGDIAGDLSGAPGRAVKPAWQWSLEIAGFVATVCLVTYITRRAQRILGPRLESGEGLAQDSPPAE